MISLAKRTFVLLLTAALLPSVVLSAQEQQLRHAVVGADVIVVATHVGVQPLGEDWLLHKLQVVSTLKGEAPSLLTVAEPRLISLHMRPKPSETRLYCLHDFDDKALEIGLPQGLAPYFIMNGYPGSHPPISDHSQGPAVQFVGAILDAEQGRRLQQASSTLMRQALLGAPELRIDAVRALTERAPLRRILTGADRNQLMARAVVETKDVPFKIALAEFCGEERMPGIVGALAIGMDGVNDPRYAGSLGRIAWVLHGEDATTVLHPHLLAAGRGKNRGQFILALGATGTESARQLLERMRQTEGPDPYIDKALRALR